MLCSSYAHHPRRKHLRGRLPNERCGFSEPLRAHATDGIETGLASRGTHNPNLAVVCDADQIIRIYIDKADGNRMSYESGAIEDNPINKTTVDVLEGTYQAFDNRRKKYHKPTTKGSQPGA
jgi:hypothetical protein